MKRVSLFTTLFALMVTLNVAANPLAGGDPAGSATAMTDAKWESFSKSLVRGLASEHKGLQQSAMRLAIQYAENTDISAAVFDLVKIYRNSDDENMRRMAVVTIGKMQHPWAMDFLARSERFEKSPCVRKQIRLALAAGNEMSATY